MTDFQFYEFQTLERSLTTTQQDALSYLSTESYITDNRAVFTYSYGDLPRQSEDLVARLFDAMLYLSTWGSKKLIWRLPHTFNTAAIQPYLIPHRIRIQTVNHQSLLVISLGETSHNKWIDGIGQLTKITPLRSDLINGDYRMLYLAWLRAAELGNLPHTAAEPPRPTELNNLTPPLLDFANFFRLDRYLFAAAVRPSTGQRTAGDLLYQANLLNPQNTDISHVPLVLA